MERVAAERAGQRGGAVAGEWSGVEWPGTQRGWMYTDIGRRGERGWRGRGKKESEKGEKKEKDEDGMHEELKTGCAVGGGVGGGGGKAACWVCECGRVCRRCEERKREKRKKKEG